jgi:DNA-binding transcriptional ArsR family regulator
MIGFPLPSAPTRPSHHTGGAAFLFLSVRALTSIYVMVYIHDMESVFEIIAEPNRRAILGLLAASQQSVGEIASQLRMPQTTVSKHLRVLREAGFVESKVDAQRRLYQLRPEPFQEVDAWLAQFRRYWSTQVDALERHLDRMAQSLPNEDDDDQPSRPRRERDEGDTQ